MLHSIWKRIWSPQNEINSEDFNRENVSRGSPTKHRYTIKSRNSRGVNKIKDTKSILKTIEPLIHQKIHQQYKVSIRPGGRMVNIQPPKSQLLVQRRQKQETTPQQDSPQYSSTYTDDGSSNDFVPSSDEHRTETKDQPMPDLSKYQEKEEEEEDDDDFGEMDIGGSGFNLQAKLSQKINKQPSQDNSPQEAFDDFPDFDEEDFDWPNSDDEKTPESEETKSKTQSQSQSQPFQFNSELSKYQDDDEDDDDMFDLDLGNNANTKLKQLQNKDYGGDLPPEDDGKKFSSSKDNSLNNNQEEPANLPQLNQIGKSKRLSQNSDEEKRVFPLRGRHSRTRSLHSARTGNSSARSSRGVRSARTNRPGDRNSKELNSRNRKSLNTLQRKALETFNSQGLTKSGNYPSDENGLYLYRSSPRSESSSSAEGYSSTSVTPRNIQSVIPHDNKELDSENLKEYLSDAKTDFSLSNSFKNRMYKNARYHRSLANWGIDESQTFSRDYAFFIREVAKDYCNDL